MPYYYPPDSGVVIADEMIDDRVAALLREGEMIDLVYDDYANTLTINLDIPKGDEQEDPQQYFFAAVYNTDAEIHEKVKLRNLDVQVTEASSALSGTPVTVAIDWEAVRTEKILLTGGTGNLTITFSNLKAGRKLSLFISKSGGATVSAVTWPASVKTAGGTPLAITSGNVGDWYEFECFSDTVVVGVARSAGITGL